MKYAVCIVVGLWLPLASVGQEPDPAKHALETLEKTWESLKAFRAVYTSRTPDAEGRTVESSGKLEMLRHDGTMKYRLNQAVSVLNNDGTPQSTSRTVTLYDGTRTYVSSDVAGAKSITILDPDREAERIPLDARALLMDLQEAGALALANENGVDAAGTLIFQGTPSGGSLAQRSGAVTMQVHVDSTTGIPLRWVYLDDDGNRVAEGRYTEVEFNPELSPADFVFEVPVGATVVDETDREQQPDTGSP